MSKRLWVLPVLAALLVAGSGVGYAIPSLGGPTGVVTTPNALVAPVGQLQVAASYQSMNNLLVSGLDSYTPLDDDYSVWSLQALAGVANGAELWAAYSKDNSDFDFSTWAIGGKYVIYTDPANALGVALGAGYLSGNGDVSNLAFYLDPFTSDLVDVDVDANVKNAYLVVTKDFASVAGSEWSQGSKLLGSLGVIYMDLDGSMSAVGDIVDESGDFGESLIRPFVSIQWINADKVYLGLEYRWKDSDLDVDPVFSAVLGGEFVGGWTGEVGTTNADQFGFGLDNQNWFVRLGYNFATGTGW